MKLYKIWHKELRKWILTHIEIAAKDESEAVSIYCKYFNCSKSLVKATEK